MWARRATRPVQQRGVLPRCTVIIRALVKERLRVLSGGLGALPVRSREAAGQLLGRQHALEQLNWNEDGAVSLRNLECFRPASFHFRLQRFDLLCGFVILREGLPGRVIEADLFRAQLLIFEEPLQHLNLDSVYLT